VIPVILATPGAGLVDLPKGRAYRPPALFSRQEELAMADVSELVTRLADAIKGKSPIGSTIGFDVKGVGGVVITGANEVKAAPPVGDVVIELDEATLSGLLSRSLNPMAAYTSGKIKVKGNLMLAQKLVSLFS
jgi:putative sterol carrier protein